MSNFFQALHHLKHFCDENMIAEAPHVTLAFHNVRDRMIFEAALRNFMDKNYCQSDKSAPIDPNDPMTSIKVYDIKVEFTHDE